MNTIKSEIFSNGKLISTNIISLDIIKTVNKIPYAQLVLCEGGNDQTTIEMSKESCFKPGEKITIALAVDGQSIEFVGIIVKQGLKKEAGSIFLTIDIKDCSYKLTLLRRNAVYQKKDDIQIMKDIIARTKDQDLKFEGNFATCQHEQMVQYYCTDWDFIVSRAEANGFFVSPENGTVRLVKPDLLEAASEISEVYEFELEADLKDQYQASETIAWDIKEVKLSKVPNSNDQDLSKDKLKTEQDFASISRALGTQKYTLFSGIQSEPEELEAWANALMIKNRYSWLKGRVSVKGNPVLKLGDTITIGGLGDMFSGKALIAGIRHRISSEGWITDIQCGLSNEWFYKNDDIIEKPAAGLLPGVNGLQIGIVEAFPSDGDPSKFHRIKVRIPAVDEKESIIWARLNLPYAGKDRGILWVPEEGDEVVIGFFNDDPRHAVVLGSLYNGQTDTPLEFTDKNNQKGFITRNGIKVVFTDEKDKEKLEIVTPGGNQALFEDENGITVTDKNQNQITLHDQGMTFEDKNKNKIIADDKGVIVEDTNKNSLTLNNEGIEIKDLNGNTITLSSAGLEIKDMNGNKVALEAGGITVESAANVTIKGAMVNLN